MPKSRRSRTDDSNPGCSDICILHSPEIEHGQFTPFSRASGQPGEELSHLHNVRDQHLREPVDYLHRMVDICDTIYIGIC